MMWKALAAKACISQLNASEPETFFLFFSLRHNRKFHTEHHLISSSDFLSFLPARSQQINKTSQKFTATDIKRKVYSREWRTAADGERWEEFPFAERWIKFFTSSLITPITQRNPLIIIIIMCWWHRAIPSYTSVRVVSNHWNWIFTIEAEKMLSLFRAPFFTAVLRCQMIFSVVKSRERECERKENREKRSGNCILTSGNLLCDVGKKNVRCYERILFVFTHFPHHFHRQARVGLS